MIEPIDPLLTARLERALFSDFSNASMQRLIAACERLLCNTEGWRP